MLYLGGPIVVLSGDGPDETLHIQLGGAGLLARGICALQAPAIRDSGSVSKEQKNVHSGSG